MIYIYDDGHHATASVQIALNLVGYTDVRFCTSSMVLDRCLNNARLFIMPGGADLYFCEKLNGLGNQIIRDFVENGGAYLGICASAYYACSQLDWACGEIDGSRELAFYNGAATGPIYDWVESPDDIYKGSWIKATKIKTSDGQQFLSQYNGGPLFEETSDTIIARYCDLENSPPAIVSGTFGRGKFILSSPHIEKFGQILTDGLYKHLNKSYNREAKEIDKLLAHENAQKEFFKSIIEKLL